VWADELTLDEKATIIGIFKEAPDASVLKTGAVGALYDPAHDGSFGRPRREHISKASDGVYDCRNTRETGCDGAVKDWLHRHLMNYIGAPFAIDLPKFDNTPKFREDIDTSATQPNCLKREPFTFDLFLKFPERRRNHNLSAMLLDGFSNCSPMHPEVPVLCHQEHDSFASQRTHRVF
jgi:hypothetical protein